MARTSAALLALATLLLLSPQRAMSGVAVPCESLTRVDFCTECARPAGSPPSLSAPHVFGLGGKHESRLFSPLSCQLLTVSACARPCRLSCDALLPLPPHACLHLEDRRLRNHHPGAPRRATEGETEGEPHQLPLDRSPAPGSCRRAPHLTRPLGQPWFGRQPCTVNKV
jgi:hypothetical protein